MIKQYFVILLPFLAIFLTGKNHRLLKLLLYLLGLWLGFLPLFFYLRYHHILQDYFFWVLGFNAKRVVFSVFLPLGIAFLASWGAYLLLTRFRKTREVKFLILFCALCLSTLSSLTMTSRVEGSYYLAFWFFISAIVASGCALTQIFQKIRPLLKRSVAFGLFLSFFFALTAAPMGRGMDREIVSQLMRYCSKDTCVVFLPGHPLFSHDATRLYSFWQYSFAGEDMSVKADVIREPLSEKIITTRPAVVVCRYLGRDFLIDLFQKKLISALEYKKLVTFFKDNYSQEYIGKQKYYIRTDRTSLLNSTKKTP